MQLMLHSHPRIAIPPETRFLLRAYDERRDFGDLEDPANLRKLAEWMTKGHNFSDLGLDRAAMIEEIAAGAPTIGSAAGAIFQAYARKHDKPRWGDKRPAYLLNLDVLRWMFPNAQIVHIIRDGRDCVASMKEADWFRGPIDKGISSWVRGMAAAERAAKVLPPDQFFELHYEDLVRDPETELRKLCDFLGEEFAPEMMEPAKVAAIAVPERKVWHALTHGEVTTSRVGSWRDRLDPEEIGLCERVMGRQLRRRGYDVTGEFSVSVSRQLRYAKRTVQKFRERASRELSIRKDRLRPPTELAARPVVPSQNRSRTVSEPR
jgi:sulfotransferase family protein